MCNFFNQLRMNLLLRNLLAVTFVISGLTSAIQLIEDPLEDEIEVEHSSRVKRQFFNFGQPQTFPIPGSNNQGGFNQGGFNQGGLNRGRPGQQGQGGFGQGGFGQGGFGQGGFGQGGFAGRPQVQPLNNRPQVFDITTPQTFPAPGQSFFPNQNPGVRPNRPNRPIRPNRPNRPINCNNPRNQHKRQCQGANLGGLPGASAAFQQIPWLNQLSSDNQSIRIPGLPNAPSSESQKRFFLLGNEQADTPFQQCLTPRFEQGHCRYLQHCILPDFISSFAHFLRYVCFIQGVYVGVCCPDSRYPELAATTTTTTTTTTTPRPTTPASDSRGCGLNIKDSKRIVGGKNADPQEWPWIAALLRNGQTQYCGGVLITDRHVLTASHCVDGFDRNSITVRLGEYTFDQADNTQHIDFAIANIKLHEDYDRTTYVNDIAMLTLASPTAFNADIWPVCLPPVNDLFEGETATVTGWGTIYYGGPVATTLQEVTIPIWTNTECDSAYEADIVSKFLCAGAKEGGKDSCQGDSGGPLLLQVGTQRRWAVIGVVSWGIKCAEPNNPGVYTRVNLFLDWIRANAVF